MEDGMKIEDVVNLKSKFETLALAESEVKGIKKGEIIQFERRGFFICDKIASETDDGLMVFNFIPDGKTKAMSVVSTKVDAKMSSKGADDGKKTSKKQQKKEGNKEKKENKGEKPKGGNAAEKPKEGNVQEKFIEMKVQENDTKFQFEMFGYC
jgi:glutamyl-tRNA synthetase